MEGVSRTDAQEAMRLASHKLPLRTKFVAREGH
jgi:ribosomal protein L16/L10AE